MAKKIKSDVRLEAGVSLPNKTASRALIIDGSNNLVESTVTSTELTKLSGLTGTIVTTTDVGVSVASLVAGKVPASQLPNAIMEYQGLWNASTNSPSLADGGGNADPDIGNVYRVSVAGSQDLGSGSITFAVGDYAILNASKVWEKADTTDAVSSVNGDIGAVVLDSADLNNTQADVADWTVADGSSIKAHLDEVGQRLVDLEGATDADENVKVSATDTTTGFLNSKVVVAQGSNTTNILEKSILNPAGNEQVQIQIDQAKIDHDALLNFVANEHIDHTAVSISTAANSGLAGGGDISSTRSLSLDITNLTAETSASNADLIAIHDDSAAGVRKMTRANFLAGVGQETGDIALTTFAFADNQVAAANVTALAFANASVRSFVAEVSIERNASFEHFSLVGIQKSASWEMTIESVGDDAGITFSITTAGQIQYVSTSTGDAGTMRFRAKAISF